MGRWEDDKFRAADPGPRGNRLARELYAELGRERHRYDAALATLYGVSEHLQEALDDVNFEIGAALKREHE